MPSPSLLLALLAVLPAALAQSDLQCFDGNTDNLTAADYQEAAAGVCLGAESETFVVSVSGVLYTIEASAVGDTRDNCQLAYDEIITTCVVQNGRNGGSWSDGSEAYDIQSSEQPQAKRRG